MGLTVLKKKSSQHEIKYGFLSQVRIYTAKPANSIFNEETTDTLFWNWNKPRVPTGCAILSVELKGTGSAVREEKERRHIRIGRQETWSSTRKKYKNQDIIY